MYTQIFENVFPEVLFPFNYAPGKSRIFGWMVRISAIQQFPEFLETFPGNFCIICHRFKIFESFGWMESAHNYTTFDNGFATRSFMNSKDNILNKKGLKVAEFFIIQISEKIYP